VDWRRLGHEALTFTRTRGADGEQKETA
jgi:hypothetical protein